MDYSSRSGGSPTRDELRTLPHAAIRHLVSASGRWDTAGDGDPICREDLAGTLVSFS